MLITVITNAELGWDCVVEVIKGDEETAKQWVRDNMGITGDPCDVCYVFTETTI